MTKNRFYLVPVVRLGGATIIQITVGIRTGTVVDEDLFKIAALLAGWESAIDP